MRRGLVCQGGYSMPRGLVCPGCDLYEAVTQLSPLQDTNALVFSGLVAAVGVSVAHGLHLNSLSVPRRAGDAAGALMQLTGTDGRSLLCNVEYNQLHALLVAAGDSRGDAG